MPTITRQQVLRDLDERNAKLLLEIERDTRNSDDRPLAPSRIPLTGSPVELRGIPAIGYGVQGAIRGTRP